MKRTLATLLLIVAAVPAVHADEPAASDAATAASEASVRELLDLTQAQKLMDGAMKQVDAMVQATMKQTLGAQTITDEQQKILDDMRIQMVAVMKDELSWTNMQPMMLDIYEKSFTQHEMDGMIAFYKSDAGQAVVAKMPTVMQYTMQAVQVRMAALAPRLQALQRDYVTKLKAAAVKSDGEKPVAAVKQG